MKFKTLLIIYGDKVVLGLVSLFFLWSVYGSLISRKPEEVEIPSSLDTPQFRQSWVEWCAYRAKKGKRVSEYAASRQLTKLARAGPAAAAWAIEQSIASDYQGLFPENHDGATKPKAGAQVGKAAGGQYRQGDRVDP